jgi:sugar lactone lactonase YvrE
MDWGPDGRLYGPRWFHGEVVSIDVDTGEWRVEADGFEVPAAVKFSVTGELHVLDTGAGRVVRVGADGRSVVAELAPGLDNLAFDAAGRLFVSSFTDGYVQRIDPDGSVTTLSPGGLAHPGGVAVFPGSDGALRVAVADLHALRVYDAATGEALDVQRNILGVGALGSVLSVAASGDRLLLAAFTDGDVRVWDPAANEVVSRFEGLESPVSAIAYGGMVAVTEHGTGRVLGLDGAREVVLAEGLQAPTGLATDGDRLFVTDRRLGRVLEIARDGVGMPARTVAEDLNGPEGLAWAGDALIVVEGDTGRVLRLPMAADAPTGPELLAMVSPGSPPASEAADAPQPPSLVFNGIAVHDGTAYVTGETGRVLYRIDIDAPSRDAPPADVQ